MDSSRASAGLPRVRHVLTRCADLRGDFGHDRIAGWGGAAEQDRHSLPAAGYDTARDNDGFGVTAGGGQRSPPKRSPTAPPPPAQPSPEGQREAEEFFMRRGARRAAVEGGGDVERSGNRPFGTEQSLEVCILDTSDNDVLTGGSA